MKKRKISYDLTAQQKKKLKRQQEENENNVSTPSSDAAGEVTIDSEQKKTKKNMIICICAVALAVVLIALAILLPIWINSETVTNETFLNWKNFNSKDPDNPYTDDNPNPAPLANPVVTFTLTGDDKEVFSQVFGVEELEIDIELFMDKAPYSSMNLMYLVESGFYNGTIINDLNNQHAMFCGFKDTRTDSNRARERNFIYNLKGFYNHTNPNYKVEKSDDFMLGYRLQTENTNITTGKFGYLAMLAGSNANYSTSTAFMLMTDESPKLSFGDIGDESGYPIDNYLSWIGRVIFSSDDDVATIKKFNEIKTTANGNFLCPVNNIRISSAKTDLSSAKRKYLLEHFEELINGKLSSKDTWKNVNLNESYFKFQD